MSLRLLLQPPGPWFWGTESSLVPKFCLRLAG